MDGKYYFGIDELHEGHLMGKYNETFLRSITMKYFRFLSNRVSMDPPFFCKSKGVCVSQRSKGQKYF